METMTSQPINYRVLLRRLTWLCFVHKIIILNCISENVDFQEQQIIMPTVLSVGPYRFFFYSSDKDEPVHIHIERDDNIAKVWLDPIRLHNSGGFSRSEINRILSILNERQIELLEAWNDYFSD